MRRRLAPADRRCFAFFHPHLVDEPLIFVEVALMPFTPASIADVLREDRARIRAEEATTAVFCSISTCQEGLRGISLGNFLIKRVVENLRRELPKLDTFVTLSPVPGFAAWLARELTAEDSEAIGPGYRALAEMLYDTGWAADPAKSAAVQSALTVAAAYYFLRARNPRAKPVDPVARFHLGNGAGRERINFAGDLSASGMRQARGLMVNYLYQLDDIEANHEAFVGRNEVVAAPAIQRMLRQRQDRPQRALVALCGSEGAANAAGGKGTRELTS